MRSISAGPYQFQAITSQGIALSHTIALVPAYLWGIWRFGPWGLLVITLTLAGTLGVTIIAHHFLGRNQNHWPLSALSGIGIAMFMPVNVPLPIPFVAGAVGAIIGIVIWGGSARMWFNPAALALVFVYLSWPGIYDLAQVSTGTNFHQDWYNYLRLDPLPGLRPTEILNQLPSIDRVPELPLFHDLFLQLGLNVPDAVLSMIAGFNGGLPGTTGVFLLLASSVFLLGSGLVDWRIPLIGYGTAALVVLLFGGLVVGDSLGRGDLVFFTFDGNFLAVLFFLAVFPSTLPQGIHARWLYSISLGLVFGIVGIFSRHPLGYVMALVFANILLPLFDSIGRKNPKTQVLP